MSVQAEAQIREALSRLETDPQSGLTEEVAQQRLLDHGPNEIKESERQSPIVMFLAQFKGVMTMLLIVAGIISAITGDLKDTVVIAVVVLLNAVMGFVQEYRAEKAVAALKKMSVSTVRVLRGGRIVEMPANQLVPGDIVRLQAGDSVPADGRLIDASNLTIEEAALTGESVPVEKDALHVADPGSQLGDRKSDVFTGTTVVQGRGTFVVDKTGMDTQLGGIAEMIGHSPTRQTPLQKRLGQLGLYLAIAAVSICALVFIAGVFQGRDISMMLLAAITLAVAAVPESLPAVITISLALGAQRMVKRHALIRRLPAVETLGCVTAICTDKTGTLTQNRMQVDTLYVAGNLLKRADTGFEDAGRMLVDDSPQSAAAANADVLSGLEAMSLCNDSEIQLDEDGVVQAIGDPTETSLILAAVHAGMDVHAMRDRLPRVAEVPFDSARKRMTTIHEASGGFFAFTKGALDVVLPRCTREMVDGVTRELSKERIAEIIGVSEECASRGARVIAAASRTLEEVPSKIVPESVESDLTFLGFAAISDPPRPEVPLSVTKCKDGGIHVYMITGDHGLTAAAIGRDLGIISEDDAVCTGAMLDGMDDAVLAEELVRYRVFARVSPEHKVRIVSALQEKGNIVAMTGDGVNDAPSLKRSDVGVAMGITGTDVSREASDIVLTDDNFATIVSAVEEGRTIYDNIRKFVRYQLATNTGEILTMFIGLMAGYPLPLLPIQILWVNLVTDGLPALALGVEPAEGDVMKRPPRAPDENVLARGLWQHVVWVGVLIALGTLALFVYRLESHGLAYARTMAFFSMAVFQLCHVMAIRREREPSLKTKLSTNKSLALAVIGTFVLQITITYVGPLAKIFKNVPISVPDMLLCVVVCTTVFFAVELEKAVARRRHNPESGE